MKKNLSVTLLISCNQLDLFIQKECLVVMVFFLIILFALVADNVLYLKVDREILDEFTVKNLTAFTYHKQGKECEMSYYQAPDNALEDGEGMNI